MDKSCSRGVEHSTDSSEDEGDISSAASKPSKIQMVRLFGSNRTKEESMSVATRIDAKGKVYTARITKRPVRVLVQACGQTFIGTVHVTADNRLIDELNDVLANSFLALTDVRVYNQGAETLLYTTSFLALNKEHIIAIAPLDDLALDAPRSLGVWLPGLRAALRGNGTSEVAS